MGDFKMITFSNTKGFKYVKRYNRVYMNFWIQSLSTFSFIANLIEFYWKGNLLPHHTAKLNFRKIPLISNYGNKNPDVIKISNVNEPVYMEFA